MDALVFVLDVAAPISPAAPGRPSRMSLQWFQRVAWLSGFMGFVLLSRSDRSRENEDLDEELRQVIDAPSLEAPSCSYATSWKKSVSCRGGHRS